MKYNNYDYLYCCRKRNRKEVEYKWQDQEVVYQKELNT